MFVLLGFSVVGNLVKGQVSSDIRSLSHSLLVSGNERTSQRQCIFSLP